MTASCHPFDLYVQKPEREWRIAQAALLFCTDRYPTMTPAPFLQRLNRLAAAVDGRQAGSVDERLEALYQVLTRDEGLRGNTEDYYDPRNSYLNEVLTRGLGLPIALCAVWMDVGAALSWPIYGIGMPGRFMIGYRDEERVRIVDVFASGREISQEECAEIVTGVRGPGVRLTQAHLQPTSPRALLTRMLTNLHNVYLQQQDWAADGRVLERMVALNPDNAAILDALRFARRRQAEWN